MNEEQLADLLNQHLDTLWEGSSLPKNLPPEVADLLVVAQSVSEVAPSPRPEFGAALKASLLDPTVNGNGATASAGSVLDSQRGLVVKVVWLVGAALLAIVFGIIIWGVVHSQLGPSTPAPLQTPTRPTQSTPSLVAPTAITEPAKNDQTNDTISTPTVTPVIDVLPAITGTVEIIIESPIPLPNSGDNGGGNNDGSDSSGDGNNNSDSDTGGSNNNGGDDGDRDRGHGNDPDHHDEDNPGKGGRK